jgi:hypothetical protein
LFHYFRAVVSKRYRLLFFAARARHRNARGELLQCNPYHWDLFKVAGESMDFDQALRVLYAEKKKIERVIASLEELEGITATTAVSRRRGRKSMDEEERREVSARMKRFWAERRKPHPTRP